MSDEARPRVKAALELGGERSDVEVGASLGGQPLSEKLVELKRLCMERLAVYLLRDSPTAASEDPLLQDPLDTSDIEGDDSTADDDANSNPPCPKKRK